ncbi:MAG TPA: hypothetical protein VN132_15525, partial [Bdellovibrio sp.]|nr:hypothetical protein [Bdellovibrio sp.]
MKALTQKELETLVQSFKADLYQAQLQDVLVSDRGLALGFHRETSLWLLIDLVPKAPMILLFEGTNPFRKGPKSKPVGLFLNSHGRNLFLEDLFVEEKWGRVVQLRLQNSQKNCELEIRLIPNHCNLIVKTEGKQIAWEKPAELSEPPVVENPPPARTLEEIHQEWLTENHSGAAKVTLDPAVQWEKQKKKDLEKKRKALGEIQKQIDEQKELLWQEAGNFLKSHGTLKVPEHLQACINLKESLSWNIENCFSKAKQIVAKKEGARDRLAELNEEISSLEKSTFSEKPKKNQLVDLMQKTEARGRKLHLSSGALAYCGKSAADNLALLRQAKAWDYWLHLKDYPGAHAIIHREREREISNEEIQEVAAWLAKESLSSKSLMLGQKVAVVMVECRFVRPIKGDKLGRVTYHSEKTFHF